MRRARRPMIVERFAGRTRDRDVAAFDDGGLLAGDGRDRGAQLVGVIEIDVRHHGDAAVPGMGRVEAAAQAHLHERQVELRLREMAEDGSREELELGRVAVASCHPVRHGQDRLRRGA